MRQRALPVAGLLEQVGADRVDAVVAVQALADLVEDGEPGRGPSAIAAATARLSVTTGLPVTCSSRP